MARRIGQVYSGDNLSQRMFTQAVEVTQTALLNEIARNVVFWGEDPLDTIADQLGIHPMMFELANQLDESSLLWWERSGLRHAHIATLLMRIQRWHADYILAPTQDESKLLNYQVEIQTAVWRKAYRPEKNKITPEKGEHEAVLYDGRDEEDDRELKFWVLPARIVAWPSRAEIINLRTLEHDWKREQREMRDLRKEIDKAIEAQMPRLPKIDEEDYSEDELNNWINVAEAREAFEPEVPENLAKALAKLQDKPLRVPMNPNSLKYPLADWIRAEKPVLLEEYRWPSGVDALERYKKDYKYLRSTLHAVVDGKYGAKGRLRRLAWRWLNKGAKFKIKGLSLMKRIHAQILRKFTKKRLRPEAFAYLPPQAAGDMWAEHLNDIVKTALAFQKKDIDTPWVIEVQFDAEGRCRMSDNAPVLQPSLPLILKKARLDQIRKYYEENPEAESIPKDVRKRFVKRILPDLAIWRRPEPVTHPMTEPKPCTGRTITVEQQEDGSWTHEIVG